MLKDAQEFSQLFLTTLQSTFVSATTENEQNTENKGYNVINKLFQGDCAYITEHVFFFLWHRTKIFQIKNLVKSLKIYSSFDLNKKIEKHAQIH